MDIIQQNKSLSFKEMVVLREQCNDILLTILDLYLHKYPKLRFNQALHNLGLSEVSYGAEPYEVLQKLLPKIMDLIKDSIYLKYQLTKIGFIKDDK